jgi:hypothetical protein
MNSERELFGHIVTFRLLEVVVFTKNDNIHTIFKTTVKSFYFLFRQYSRSDS